MSIFTKVTNEVLDSLKFDDRELVRTTLYDQIFTTNSYIMKRFQSNTVLDNVFYTTFLVNSGK